jgi:hypothetical protein
MQADIIVKAIDDLTHALKGRKNVKGNPQIEALEKIDELLNNIPKNFSTVKEKQVTPNENEKIRPWIPAFLTYIFRFCRGGGV